MLTDFRVHLRPAVTEELPPVPDLTDHLQVQVRDHHLVLVLAAFDQYFTAGVDEIAGSVEPPEFPGFLQADAVVGANEHTIGHGLGRLLKFPQVL